MRSLTSPLSLRLELPATGILGVTFPEGRLRIENRGGAPVWIADPKVGGGNRMSHLVELKALHPHRSIRLEPGAVAEADMSKSVLLSMLREAGPGEVRVTVVLAYGPSEGHLDQQAKAETSVRVALPSFLEPFMEELGIDLIKEERIRRGLRHGDRWAWEKVEGGSPELVEEWLSWILSASPGGTADAGVLMALRELGARGVALAERHAETCPAHRHALRVLRLEAGEPEEEDRLLAEALLSTEAPIELLKHGGHPRPGSWRRMRIEGETLTVAFSTVASTTMGGPCEERSRALGEEERRALKEELARSGIWLATASRMLVADEPMIELKVALPGSPLTATSPYGQWYKDPRSAPLERRTEAWARELKEELERELKKELKGR